MKWVKTLLASTGLALGLASMAQAQTFLNVSYDVMRDFYKEYNPLFLKEYASKHDGQTLTIQQSHGGSSKQALSVANGLQADVVTMNQSSDIELLEKKGLVHKGWQQAFPNHSVPFTSVTVILVRKGNPKHIHDWADLAKPDVKTVIANPKTTGNGRYAFLSMYGAALKANHDDATKAGEQVRAILKNIPVRDNGGRAATTTFMQRQVGDALITFENEAVMAAREFNKDQFEVIYPSYTVASESPVAVVDSVVAKKGSEQIAKEYLNYLWSEPAQELAAKLYLRPSDTKVLEKHRDRFPKVDTFNANEKFGDWPTIMKTFFADGGLVDQLDKP